MSDRGKKDQSRTSILQGWAQIITGIVSVVAMVILACVANKISETQNHILIEQRRQGIRPEIEVSSETEFDQGLEDLRVCLRNIGFGIARSVRVMIESDSGFTGDIVNGFRIASLYDSSGRNSDARDQVSNRIPNRLRDMIAPDEIVRFRVSTMELFHIEYEAFKKLSWDQRFDMAIPAPITFYISYFDLDGNEYLNIVKVSGGGGVTAVQVFLTDSLANRLHRLGKSLNTFSSVSLRDPGIRDSLGWFRR